MDETQGWFWIGFLAGCGFSGFAIGFVEGVSAEIKRHRTRRDPLDPSALPR